MKFNFRILCGQIFISLEMSKSRFLDILKILGHYIRSENAFFVDNLGSSHNRKLKFSGKKVTVEFIIM